MTELFAVLTSIREILVQSSLMGFFVTISTNSELFRWSLFTQLTFVLAIVIFLFENFFYLPQSILYLAYISMVTSAMLVLWRLYCQLKLLRENSISTPAKSSELFERSIYTFCLIFNILGRFLIFITLTVAKLPRGYHSSLYNYVDILIVLIIISVGGRKTRENYYLSKVDPLFLASDLAVP